MRLKQHSNKHKKARWHKLLIQALETSSHDKVDLTQIPSIRELKKIVNTSVTQINFPV